MEAIRYRFRSEARRRWPAWLALVLVVGLAGGVVLASVAGARRTRSAYDRFLVAQDAFDVTLVSGIEGIFDIAELDLDRIAALPQVAEAAPYVAMGAVAHTPKGRQITPDAVNFAASPGDRFGGAMNRRKLLEGRAADPDRADEVVVGFGVADEYDLTVGDVLETDFLSNDEAAAIFGGEGATSILPSEPGQLEPLRVVGIAATPGEFPPATNTLSVSDSIALTPTAFASHPDNFNVEILALTLQGGVGSVPAFLAEVEALTPGGGPVFSISQQDVTTEVQGALDSPAGALTLSAALAGAVLALLVGQALARQASVEGGDEEALRAVGLTLGQIGGLRLLKAGTVAALGTLCSMVIAVALSSLFPVGLAAKAEPDPGVDLDPLVLGIGAPAVFAATVALVAGSAWRAHRASRPTDSTGPSPRPSRLAGALAGIGAPPSAVAGAHLAADPGSSRMRLTARSSVATIALGVATVVGVVTFVASLDRLVSTPSLYGWTWDEVIGNAFASNFDGEEISFLGDDPALASVSVGNTVEVTIDRTRMSLTGMDMLKGAVQPALVSGAPPVSADELVLASDVLEGTEIGEPVTVALAGREAPYQLVGRAVLPLEAGFATLEGLRRLAPDLQPQLALVGYALGADRPAFRDRAADTLSLDEQDFFPASLPVDLVNFGGADAAPLVVAGLMAVVATATLVHTLALAATRRRHDLGVLRVLGFTRRQSVATVAWQATVLMVTALVLAVPAGIATGRVVWLGFANQLGVVPSPVVPGLTTLAVVGASLAVAQLAAAVPAWRAARLSPTNALRAE